MIKKNNRAIAAAISVPHDLDAIDIPIIPPNINIDVTIMEYTIHFVQYLKKHIKIIDKRKERPNIPNIIGQYFTKSS